MRMNLPRRLAAALLFGLIPSTASAEIVLSQMVAEIRAGSTRSSDIEIWNNDRERAYVVITPSEILSPGTPAEQRAQAADPEALGLLISPTRMILEPGQRKLIRITPIAATPARERVYRIEVRPTVGDLETSTSGLKMLIGYDVLVLRRPKAGANKLVTRRVGDRIAVRNDAPHSVELAGGKACRTRSDCQELPGKRLYPGAEWEVAGISGRRVEYTVIGPGSVERAILDPDGALLN
jgi:P pilus assembly chaperone PapD